MIPSDGEVIEGVAYVSEAAITGESAPVLKEPGTDIASSVTGGTQVISDWLVIRITAEPGKTFLDRMIALVEGAARQKTPNEIALNILLAGLTIIFLIVVVTLAPARRVRGSPASIDGPDRAAGDPDPDDDRRAALGDRHRRHGPAGAAQRAGDERPRGRSGGRHRCPAARQDRHDHLRHAAWRPSSSRSPGVSSERADRGRAALLARRRDAGRQVDRRAGRAAGPARRIAAALNGAEFIPFTRRNAHERRAPQRPRDDEGRGRCRRPRGAGADSVRSRRGRRTGSPPRAARRWRWSRTTEPLGVIYLKDTVKPGMRERFDELRAMGIRTIMITGDNPLTAQTIADEAGVDDFVAEAKPEDKIRIIREQQAEGRLVAMTGDGTNDAPALAQADVGVAMNTGTAAAKEAGNMVDLDSDPTKLIEIVAIGKQLLMTRGALTTFSIANDVAKYFAIIPAMFVAAYRGGWQSRPARRAQRHAARRARRARSSRRSSSTR